MISTAANTPRDLRAVHHAMVQAAIAAPSPDNNQPWKFRSAGDVFEVYLDRSRSLPSDVLSMFDMTSIGAAVENAVIAASGQGFRAEVTWCAGDPSPPGTERPVVEIRVQAGGSYDPLCAAISQRSTCRKMYSSAPLKPELLDQLAAACAPFPAVQVDWLTTKEDKKRFGKLIAMTDALRFQHQPFHEELFRQLRFSPKEAESTQDGLDVRTLELPPGLSLVLPLLRRWSVMRAIINLKLLPLLTLPSVVSVQRSGAIAIFSVPEELLRPAASASEMFCLGGRAIQRLWLAATAAGLSLHPLGSISIFLLQENPQPAFLATIEKARGGVSRLLPSVSGRVIQLALRVGTSAPPSQRSLRRTFDQVVLEQQS